MSIQQRKFSDGSFVLHGVTLAQYKGRFSVWAKASGEMYDCEYLGAPNTAQGNGKAIPVRNFVLRHALAGIAKAWA